MPNRKPPTTYVRCGIPDCDWGTPVQGFDQLHACRELFRQHCVECHGVNPEETERMCWLNLRDLTMTLIRGSIATSGVPVTGHQK